MNTCNENNSFYPGGNWVIQQKQMQKNKKIRKARKEKNSSTIDEDYELESDNGEVTDEKQKIRKQRNANNAELTRLKQRLLIPFLKNMSFVSMQRGIDSWEKTKSLTMKCALINFSKFQSTTIKKEHFFSIRQSVKKSIKNNFICFISNLLSYTQEELFQMDQSVLMMHQPRPEAQERRAEAEGIIQEVEQIFKNHNIQDQLGIQNNAIIINPPSTIQRVEQQINNNPIENEASLELYPIERVVVPDHEFQSEGSLEEINNINNPIGGQRTQDQFDAVNGQVYIRIRNRAPSYSLNRRNILIIAFISVLCLLASIDKTELQGSARCLQVLAYLFVLPVENPSTSNSTQNIRMNLVQSNSTNSVLQETKAIASNEIFQQNEFSSSIAMVAFLLLISFSAISICVVLLVNSFQNARRIRQRELEESLI